MICLASGDACGILYFAEMFQKEHSREETDLDQSNTKDKTVIEDVKITITT